jgi:hypothetical protein
VAKFLIEICRRPVPAIKPTDGVRAVIKNKPIEPESVERYLESKFGDSFGAVRAAMRDLANAFGLNEKFRPAIPEGVTGWGAKGNLDIDRIRFFALKK